MRTLRSLGQLYAAEEEWRPSIDNYVAWRDFSFDEDDLVFRGLSYAHYQLEEFTEALPYWVSYMEFILAEGGPLDRDDYAYLNGLYFTIEDFNKALDLTKTMIVLFDDPTDWMNLSAVYASVDDEERRVRSLNVAYLKDYFDDEARYMNLGQSMAGVDIPASGSKIIADGINKEFVEENLDNFETYTQMYLLASMWEDALEPAERTAELDETGDGYDTVGYIHYVMTNYEDAAEAFQMAIDKGELNDKGDTLMFLARSLLELDDFEGALSAAREASDLNDEDSRNGAESYITFINNTKARFDILAERRQDAIDFYETYPPLD